MHILSEVEQDRFERPPTFNSTERKQFFDFPQSAMNVAQDLRSPENQIGFLLTYGYIRAVRRFFWPNYFYDRDQSTRLILKYRSCLDLKVIVWGKFFARHEGLFRGHAGSIA